MKFINEFYQIQATAEDGEEHQMTVSFCADHPIYRAHFPHNPITPGVLLLQIGTERLEQLTGHRLLLRKVTSIRFTKPVLPTDIVTFHFSKLSEADQQLSASVTVAAGDEQYAKMSLVYNIRES